MRAELRRVLLAPVVVTTLVLGGCTDIENAMASVDFINFMHEAPFLDPYEAPRTPPPNAVPLESPGEKWEPEIEATEAGLRAWGDTMTNPLAMTEPVVTEGAHVFQTYCAVCHGVNADGTGPIVGQGKLPFATNLLLPTTQNRTDGYIYALIRVGRGLMPSYRRVPPRERWAVINYVRYLQQGGDPIQVQLPGTVQPGMDEFNTTANAGTGAAAGADTESAGQE